VRKRVGRITIISTTICYRCGISREWSHGYCRGCFIFWNGREAAERIEKQRDQESQGETQ
jgi:RNase P subunit RPR2